MIKYNIVSDYRKQKFVKLVEAESKRLGKPRYWILKQLGIPKSTYYDWIKNNCQTKNKAPHTIWNKTPEYIENKILEIRDNYNLFDSQRSPVGIVNELEKLGLFMSSGGIWKILKRNGKNRELKKEHKQYCIYPRVDAFMDVVCIDDIVLTNYKPYDTAIFNAIDEYTQKSLAMLFISHRVNKYDVISLIEQIKENQGGYPKIIRLDNAKAHGSIVVKEFCRENKIKLQFIDKGVPQQNWPVEVFNGVIQKDIMRNGFWDANNKQLFLEKYITYYNNKPLHSDYINRSPNEISSAITSKKTQMRLKYKLMRKHYGQVEARKAILNNINLLNWNLSEMCVN